jgi:membrane-associated phospholipid phosphatase
LERLATLGQRVMPRGPVDAGRQWLLFGGAYYTYRLVRGLVDGHPNIAFQHARDIVYLERSWHSFFEVDLQRWAIHNPVFIDVADWMYVNSHFVVTTAFLIWLYVMRNQSYYFVRNMFMVGMAFALIGYVVFPAAPPRFLPEWGFQDTVADLFGRASRSANVLYNPYAAVPSMHVAFALMVAVPAYKLTRRRPLKALWVVYPVVVTFVVIATANHFWFDAAVGALVAGASAWIAAAAFARVRPDAWSWRTGTAEVTA